MKTPLPMIKDGRVLSDWVTASLREAIREGLFEPGEKLDQNRIAAEWEISRTPLREAIRRLESDGYVVVHPHRGAFVVDVTRQDVVEIYQVRRLLEAEVVRQVTQILPQQALTRLAQSVEASRTAYHAGRHEEHLAHDQLFHEILRQYAANDLIGQILRALENRATLARRFALLQKTEHTHVAESFLEHEAILRALQARDPEAAAEAMAAHLLNSGQRIEVLVAAVKKG